MVYYLHILSHGGLETRVYRGRGVSVMWVCGTCCWGHHGHSHLDLLSSSIKVNTATISLAIFPTLLAIWHDSRCNGSFHLHLGRSSRCASLVLVLLHRLCGHITTSVFLTVKTVSLILYSLWYMDVVTDKKKVIGINWSKAEDGVVSKWFNLAGYTVLTIAIRFWFLVCRCSR